MQIGQMESIKTFGKVCGTAGENSGINMTIMQEISALEITQCQYVLCHSLLKGYINFLQDLVSIKQ